MDGGARFVFLVRHTDDEREWAYGRDSHFGRLDKTLDKGENHGWTVGDIKRD